MTQSEMERQLMEEGDTAEEAKTNAEILQGKYGELCLIFGEKNAFYLLSTIMFLANLFLFQYIVSQFYTPKIK